MASRESQKTGDENGSSLIIKNDDRERRRSPRFANHNADFSLNLNGSLYSCKLTNLSCLGLGIEAFLKSPEAEQEFKKLQPGSPVTGILVMSGRSLEISAVVRVKRANFLGLEFTGGSENAAELIQAHLTPQLVAASIVKLPAEMLSPDVVEAWRGDDFECILFRAGAAEKQSSLQIYAGGLVGEISQESFRLVPAPLVRSAAPQSSWSFLSEFSSYNDDISDDETKAFFEKITKIISAWDSCPANIQDIFSQNIQIKS